MNSRGKKCEGSPCSFLINNELPVLPINNKALMKIKGLVVLITGGCSGLGLATARYLIKHGAKVVLLDINEKAGAACVTELGKSVSHFIRTDVADEVSVQQAYKEAPGQFGEIRVFLHCAEITHWEPTVSYKGMHD